MLQTEQTESRKKRTRFLLFFVSVFVMLDSFAGLAGQHYQNGREYRIFFTDEDDSDTFILHPQCGFVPEGTVLKAVFPEKIVGKDGYVWESTEHSPKEIPVYGTGVQKYFISYTRKEKVYKKPEKEEKTEETQLERWLKKASEKEYEITGIQKNKEQLLLLNEEQNDRMIKNLCSVIHDENWHYFYLIGKDYLPKTQTAGLHSELVYSSAKETEFQENGSVYTVIRAGIRRKEKTENPDSVWKEGDLQVREIGGKTYTFRCVDDDYADPKLNYKKGALFLCDQVIRSDTDRDSFDLKLLSFGTDNNYKTSKIRKWLKENLKKNNSKDKNQKDKNSKDNIEIYFTNHKEEYGEKTDLVSTGVLTACTGSTKRNTWEQFELNQIQYTPIGFQLMQDELFCLSLEEAVKYREFLWKFHGSNENNPNEEISPYSEGYYLRTPVYRTGEDGAFCHSDEIYAVDLKEGNIHPVKTDTTAIGIRPAFVMFRD